MRRWSFLILICKSLTQQTYEDGTKGSTESVAPSQPPTTETELDPFQQTQQTTENWAHRYPHGEVPKRPPPLGPEMDQEVQKEMLMVSAADIIHGTNGMVWRTAEIRMRSDQCASFEIGFVFKTLQETYRKMLDMYNVTVEIRRNITEPGYMGHMDYLQRMEKLHWEIYHLHNMMHEIERKYKMDAIINGSGMYQDGTRWTKTTRLISRKTWTYSWSKRTTSWWRPLEYGWPTDYYELNWE